MLTSSTLLALDADASLALAARLGDAPGHTIEIHALTRGLGRAFVIGAPDEFQAALVESDDGPAEPHGFTQHADILTELLAQVDGWDRVLVDATIVADVERLVQTQLSLTTRLYESVHLAQRRAAEGQDDARVRILAPDDSALIASSPEDLQPDGFSSLEESLHAGIVAGAVQDGRVVAIAYVDSLTQMHGAITIYTDETHRGQGLATAAASLVVQQLHRRRVTPVWYTGWDNEGSLRVAQRLGFEVFDRPVFVIRHG
ncbi:MAG: GNAT family N-acetyltransferase [Gemmatimonadetes bacterium]|nr:GNAT family N-acetyltransferase [Gemmatimonadota bacterium]MBT6629616.1 GNAT family N-acetyltransferase [Gemmatimonadota bacterium]MBT7456671.1 GNAT family N-acetyltransferase [Gemmatimonadota bacterium]MBT7598482.1 GNAT family N-acetyltransferase [Gemmatimonadota bacterium]